MGDKNAIYLCSKDISTLKTRKSTNNRLSYFGSIEQNMEMSHII